jgi:predicted peptidase
LIIALHGDGRQGSDGMSPTIVGMAAAIRQNRSIYPVLVMIPQARLGKRFFHPEMQEMVIAQLDRTLAEFRVDPGRVYLAGFSMGAGSAYGIAARWPSRFAALVAIAGPVTWPRADILQGSEREILMRSHPFMATPDPYATLARELKALPVWIFQGAVDQPGLIDQSRRVAAALKEASANARYSELEGVDHNGAQAKVYADEAMLAWLLAQRR